MTDRRLSLADLNKQLAGSEIKALEGVTIEGDFELEIDTGRGDIGAVLGYYLGEEVAKAAIQLIEVAGSTGYPVESRLQSPN